MTVATLVFSGQAVFCVSRERQHLLSSPPGKWLMLSSVIDIGLITILAHLGIFMLAIPLLPLLSLLSAAIAFAFVLDEVKLAAFRALHVA